MVVVELAERPIPSGVDRERLERLLGRLRALPEVVAVALFGSHARGNATSSSDVDVAVFLHPYSWEAAANVALHSAEGLDVVVFNDAPPLLKHEVLRNAHFVFIRDREALYSILWRASDELQSFLLIEGML